MGPVNVSREDVLEGLADENFVLVDVREPHEFAMGRVPGSVSMPLSRFDPAELAGFAGKRVVFSCAAGVRSQNALRAAQAAGLDLNEHYAGGFRDWMMSGQPIERD